VDVVDEAQPGSAPQPHAEKEKTDEVPKTSSRFSRILPPAVGSLSFGSSRSKMLSPSKTPTKTKEEALRSSNVTSLFSSLASAVDSALDSAVDKAEETPGIDVTSEENSAWDDGDFDFPDDQSLPKETTLPPTDETEEAETKAVLNSEQSTVPLVETSTQSGEEDSVLPRLSDMPLEAQESSTGEEPSAAIGSGTPFEGNIEGDPRYKRLQRVETKRRTAYQQVSTIDTTSVFMGIPRARIATKDRGYERRGQKADSKGQGTMRGCRGKSEARCNTGRT